MHKRVRIFAGPNGSGKSTIKTIVEEKVKLGTYVNADEIKVLLSRHRSLDWEENLEEKIKNDKRTGLRVTRAVISGSWKKHTILRPTGDTPIDIDLVLFYRR